MREPGLQMEVGGRPDIKGAPGMMLAAAGGGDEAKNLVDGFAGGEFGSDNFRLAGNTAESGERKDVRAVPEGGFAHGTPSLGGARGKAHWFAVVRGGSDRPETLRLALPRHVALV